MPDRDGFVLVSSRDEAINRGQMLPPLLHQQDGAVYPLDQHSGGTWIMTSSLGFTVNILNGGFEKHQRQLPYRQSRGLVIGHFMAYADAQQFRDDYDFIGIEPFTLVVVQHEPRKLTSIVWTGQEAVLTELNTAKPSIWSSATLFSPEARLKRQAWFRDEVIDDHLTDERTDILDKLLKFHHEGGQLWNNEAERIKMKSGDGKQTVCIAAVTYNAQFWKFIYQDLLQNQQRSICMLG